MDNLKKINIELEKELEKYPENSAEYSDGFNSGITKAIQIINAEILKQQEEINLSLPNGLGSKHDFFDIKILRCIVRFKQYKLAEKLNQEQSNYANIENGKLFTNLLPDLKPKAVSILMPLLDKEILKAKNYINKLISLKNYFEK